MDKHNGYIKAEHFLKDVSNEELTNIELTPCDGEWYERYKSQIELFGKQGKPWIPKAGKS